MLLMANEGDPAAKTDYATFIAAAAAAHNISLDVDQTPPQLLFGFTPEQRAAYADDPAAKDYHDWLASLRKK
jgi:hypothetical protein